MSIPPQRSSMSFTPSPKSAQRRSLTFDEHEYAYDFPQYTYVPSPASSTSPLPPTTTIPVPPAFIHKSVVKSASSSAGAMAPPSSARFAHGYASTTSTSTLNRARGPSFASTTSYASSSTASSSSHSAASSAAPATPPRTGYALSTPTRTLRPHWERMHDGEDEEELAERLEEEVEDVPADVDDDDDDDEEFEYEAYRNSSGSGMDYTRYMSHITASPLAAASNRKPRSVRRSPFADDDPRVPYQHVYLDDDVPHPYASARASSPAARRLSGSGSARLRAIGTDSPRSVARSVSLTHSLNHSQRHSSPRRAHSPITHSHSHTPSPIAPSLSSHSHTPSSDLGPDPSLELDASPLRTALLLNPEPEEQNEVERRFSGRGLGLGLGLGGMGGGAINLALQRRRAEWTEFEGDAYSSAAPTRAQVQEDDTVDLSSRYDARSTRHGGLGLDVDVDLSSPRPSFSHPYARVMSEKADAYLSPVFSGEKKVLRGAYGEVDVDEECEGREENEEGREAKERKGRDGREEEEEVPTCLAFRWSLRARWAALKLRVRLGAFRARRRVGLV